MALSKLIIDQSDLPSGSVLQVQTATITSTTTNTTDESYLDITDASITLTTTVANSKFLLMLEGVIFAQADTGTAVLNGMNLGFRRGSTLIRGVAGSLGDTWAGGFNGSWGANGGGSYNQSRSMLDSPSLSAGTSVTYKGCVGKWTNGEAVFNYAGYNNKGSFHVLEIAP